MRGGGVVEAGTAGWEPSSLVDVLRQRAQRNPNGTAYTFLLDGETETASLTYRELDQRARAVALRLLEVAAPGERALLLYPPGLDYIAGFLGCLYAGIVAVPVYPPRLNRPDPRLAAVAADARAAVALTTPSLWSVLAERMPPALAGLHWLPLDSGELAEPEAWRPPGVHAGSLAFLQYTSGSTATPRGVMLSHGNLLHNLRAIEVGFGLTPSDRVVSWLPPYHDMGLIGGILGPLHVGCPATLLAPVDFLQRPARWLEAITRWGGTVSGGPNFAFELCLARIRPEQRPALDLSRWAVAFNGAEPVRLGTLERFAEAFGPSGFRREAWRPCYGLAEATLMVSGGPRGIAPEARSFRAADLERGRLTPAEPGEVHVRPILGCGRLTVGQTVIIVDPDREEPCAPGHPGEIWVAGPSVASGYWNQPEHSLASFGARLAGSGEARFVRTGDLGFIEGAELFVNGRLKDLIIVDGRNHYPQDIELTAETSHPGLRPGCCAAFAVDGDKERLVVVAEVERYLRTAVSPAEVAQSVRRAVQTSHDLPVHDVTLVPPGGVPRTTSGKIQRRACRALYLKGALPVWRETAQPGSATDPCDRETPQVKHDQ